MGIADAKGLQKPALMKGKKAMEEKARFSRASRTSLQVRDSS
jgi:hypothetical protein